MKGYANLSEFAASSPSSFTNAPGRYYVPAPLYRRFLALGIDQLIFYLFVLPAFGLLASIHDAEVVTTRRESTSIQGWVVLALWICCNHFFLARQGQTIGKFVTRCKVVRYDGADRGLFVILARESVGKFISSFLAVGYIWAVFDGERRALHDVIMRTYVIDCSRRALDYANVAEEKMLEYQAKTEGQGMKTAIDLMKDVADG